MSEKLFFLSRSYDYFSESLNAKSVHLGEVKYKEFTDGETYQQILTPIAESKTVVWGGTISDQDTLEIYDLSAGCAQYGAKSLDLVIPYFGYSTMERAVNYGEVVKAKSRASLLSTIPRTAMGTKVYMVDLHTDGIPYYFDSDINTVHIDAMDVWVDWIKENMQMPDLVIGSTDAGRAKWVEKLAQATQSEAAFIYKQRIDDGKVSLSAINADVENRTVLIYDDMIRSGGSMIQAIKTYLEKGASEVHVIATHGMLLNDCTKKILDLGVKSLTITNSHPNAMEAKADGANVMDITPKILQRLK